MKIQSILSGKGNMVFQIGPQQTIQDAVHTLVEHNIGSLLVVSGSQIMGIITERDILRQCAVNATVLGITLVKDIMTRDLVICRPEDSVDDAMSIMVRKHIRHLPVMDDDGIAGMISIGDIVKSQLQDSQHEIKYLRDYITGAR
jgi:CBS domain-containing protein